MPDNLQPDRRPIANVFRKTAHAAVRFCVRADIHPDTVSYGSMVAATGAAVAFYFAGSAPALLLVGTMLCYLRLWCNMLDGMVALESGKASRRGEIINEAPDRFSDVVIFVGVAHSGLANPFLGYWAAIAALLVAYIGTLGKAVGVHRDFTGTMAKQWRMVALSVGAVLAFVMQENYLGRFPSNALAGTALDVALVTILVGCVQTIVKRLRNIFRALDKLDPNRKES
jgi:phosphatidylglycerophosphate synthase